MKLYFFGDSHAYGTGLRDCITADRYAGSVHSQLSFPNIIAEMMGLPYENLGRDGASNQQILHSVRSSNITSDDMAIICWSHWSRNFANRADGGKQIMVHFKDCQRFYEIYDDSALQYASHLSIEHANLWLKHRSIPNLNFSIHDQYHDQSNAYMLDFMERHAVDQALDMIHFGERSHLIWATILSEYFVAHSLVSRITSSARISDHDISDQDIQWVINQYPSVKNIENVVKRAILIHNHNCDHVI